MIPIAFDYATPTTLEEAVRLLEANEGARVLAGSVGLIASIRARRVQPSLLVDLRKIAGLDEVRISSDGSLRVGAMTTVAALLDERRMLEPWPALVDGLAAMADPQTRNRATVAGLLASNAPGADLTAVALALDASVTVVGLAGARTIPVEGLLVRTNDTSLARGELISGIVFPNAGPACGSAYEKFRNPASGSAICGVAAMVGLSGATVDRCRVAVTGATPEASRLVEVEASMLGREPSTDVIRAAASADAAGLEFVTDLAASGEYRAHLTQVLAKRALTIAVRRTGS